LSDRQEEEGRALSRATAPRSTGPGAGDEASPFHGFVVGIGASAGGLDALERLFQALPADTGAAFVVVQHLSPDHKSMMDNLLARHTAMSVRVVEHDMPLAPNAVFLIPPARLLRLQGDRLQLSPKPEHGLVLPIDVFFASLSEQCADRALAVVLSGTGSDGSRGVVAVNAGGGFVFVQEPQSARFDGMPRSAMGTGLVDVVAPAEELARRVAAHLLAPRAPALHVPEHEVGAGEGAAAPGLPLAGILERLLASSGIDFRDYKPTTVLRRIERRMQVLRAATLGQYLQRLNASEDEQVLLRRELLIPVTRFFRDIEAFEQIAHEVAPALVERADTIEPIRVWVAACSTGEEAYSIAIVLAEAFARLGRSRPVKIFATDVEPAHLEVAAAGVYPDTIAAEVSGARLQTYFVERQGGWAVRPEIRQMVIFARHNLVADPPFTRMDLVSCRNALIYFQPAAQELALRRLQYALQVGGHLLLGPSESLGVLHRDFLPLPGRFKVYRLLRHDAQAVPAARGRHQALLGGAAYRRRQNPVPGADVDTSVHQGERLLQQAYLPPSLLVGPNRELLHVYGTARHLLQIPEGTPTLDVPKLLPRELGWAAGALLQAVTSGGQDQGMAPVQLGSGDEAQRLQMVARRLPGDQGEDLTLLSFEPLAAGAAASGEAASAAADQPVALEATAMAEAQQRRVEQLERELDLMHHSLQSTIEELETANEELQATNEELMASNEELQSTNEELQSVNEELYTVNAEYQEKVDVLNGINADLENISKATAIPTLFVDDTLRLTRFTPELARLFKVRETDRGRSIEDFAHLLDYPELYTDLRSTLAGSHSTEREVQSRDGTWWLARIQPYQSRTHTGARAVMTFIEVTSVRDSQRLQAVIDSLVEHVAVLDHHGTITLVNSAWRAFAAAHGDPELRHSGPGSNYLQVCAAAAHTEPDARVAYEGLQDVLTGRRPHFTLQYPCDINHTKLWFLMHVGPVRHASGGVVVSHIDITAWAAQPGNTSIKEQ
jgi:two-component system CheB/CheR fusion protein